MTLLMREEQYRVVEPHWVERIKVFKSDIRTSLDEVLSSGS